MESLLKSKGSSKATHLNGKSGGIQHLQIRGNPEQPDKVFLDQRLQQQLPRPAHGLRELQLDCEPGRVHSAQQPQALGAQLTGALAERDGSLRPETASSADQVQPA